VLAKFASSAWGKKLAKQSSTAAQTDFERFQAAGGALATQQPVQCSTSAFPHVRAVAKSKKGRAVRKVIGQLKKVVPAAKPKTAAKRI
jgi:hypothetical protein